MIVTGPAVVVPAALAGHVAAALADHVARTRVADPALSRLLEELGALDAVAGRMADPVADGNEPCSPAAGWLTITEAVTVYGRPARTLRHQAAAGLVLARKDHHRWLVAPPLDPATPTRVLPLRGSSNGTG